jgi:hypothetical protein
MFTQKATFVVFIEFPVAKLNKKKNTVGPTI